MSSLRTGYSFEGEVERILLFGKDSHNLQTVSYSKLLEDLSAGLSNQMHHSSQNVIPREERYSFNDIVLRMGEQFHLMGNTPVERAAARQWIQYRITRLGFRLLSEMDKHQFEKILQELDEYLCSRTYFAGMQLGIADLVMYNSTALYQYLQVEITSQRLPYRHTNLVRWFDQVQHHYQHATKNHSCLTVITNSSITGATAH